MLHVKAGYRENPGPVYFVDDVTEQRGIVFQPDVYRLAEWLSAVLQLRGIVDVGCGRADKLAAIHQAHPDWEYVGIDYDVNIEWCRNQYRWGLWLDLNLEQDITILAADMLIVCSDVIEHLINPLPLLRSLRDSGAPVVVVSTPERDVQHGYDHNGPSPNPCHVREWNAAELHSLLEANGLPVMFLGLTRGSDQGWAMGTQLAVCTP